MFLYFYPFSCLCVCVCVWCGFHFHCLSKQNIFNVYYSYGTATTVLIIIVIAHTTTVSDLNVFISLLSAVTFCDCLLCQLICVYCTYKRDLSRVRTSGYQWKFDLWLNGTDMKYEQFIATWDSCMCVCISRERRNYNTKDSDCGNWYCSLVMPLSVWDILFEACDHAANLKS